MLCKCGYAKLLEEEIKKLKEENEKLKKDFLTQCYNRHYLDELLRTEYKDKINKDWYYNIILIDLDGLHELNRKESYEAGDKFILRVVKDIKNEMKKQNISGRIFRIGGDEFLIITQPYDELCLKDIKGITIGKSYFNKDKSFREAIKEADEQIIKKKKEKKR